MRRAGLSASPELLVFLSDCPFRCAREFLFMSLGGATIFEKLWSTLLLRDRELHVRCCFATHTDDVPVFSSPAFSTPGILVLRFPVLRFPPVRFSPAFSSPAFSSHAIWSHVFQFHVFHSRVFCRVHRA